MKARMNLTQDSRIIAIYVRADTTGMKSETG